MRSQKPRAARARQGRRRPARRRGLERGSEGRLEPGPNLRAHDARQRPYAALLERLLEDAPAGAEAPAKHSFFGKLLLKAAGPRGNAPAPKALHPCAGPHGRDVLDRWAAQQERIVELHEMARGKNLAQLRFSNPFVKLFKMTGCDAFALFADHTERHVSQIESRVPGL
jgi:hypothetical protein